jgi:hypothetical protein
MEETLKKLKCMSSDDINAGNCVALYHTRPFISSAEGVYRAYLEECPISRLPMMLLLQRGSVMDFSYKKYKEVLTNDFKTQLRTAKTHKQFINFIRAYFDVAVKRWN